MTFKIWPANSFEIHTLLSREKVLDILQANIEDKILFRMNRDHKYFQGDFSKENFRINRIIHYRNSFLPIVTGLVMPEGSGCVIKVKMKLHSFVVIFMGIWLAIVILGFLGVGATVVANPSKINPGILVTLGMLIFGVALVSGSFWFEARKQQEKLITLLKP